MTAELWQEGGWVFTSRTGLPLNPRTDHTNWKKLLATPTFAKAASTTPATPPPRSSWYLASPSAP